MPTHARGQCINQISYSRKYNLKSDFSQLIIIHYSPATEVAASEDHNHDQCWGWAEKVLVLMLTVVTSGSPRLQWRALQTISRD